MHDIAPNITQRQKLANKSPVLLMLRSIKRLSSTFGFYRVGAKSKLIQQVLGIRVRHVKFKRVISPFDVSAQKSDFFAMRKVGSPRQIRSLLKRPKEHQVINVTQDVKSLVLAHVQFRVALHSLKVVLLRD